jgi:uncharacterized protein YlaI
MNICRCTICNAVNFLDAETDLGDYTQNAFFEESNGGYICFACRNAVTEALSEFRDDYEEENDEDE